MAVNAVSFGTSTATNGGAPRRRGSPRRREALAGAIRWGQHVAKRRRVVGQFEFIPIAFGVDGGFRASAHAENRPRAEGCGAAPLCSRAVFRATFQTDPL